MADYYPLLARALDALPDRSPALRKAVYDRARHALISQLRSLEPPLSEDDINLERRALDTAIERLEIDHGGLPAPANDAASPAPPPAPAARIPEPEPAPSSGARSAGADAGSTAQGAARRGLGAAPTASESPDLPEPSPPETAAPVVPTLPAAPAPTFAPQPDPAPREAPIQIAPRRPRAVPAEAPPPVAALPIADPAPGIGSALDGADIRQRPRIAIVPHRPGRSRILRNGVVGTVLVAVIALIAVTAFMLRDRPQTLSPAGPDTAGTQQPDGTEAKFGDRVSGGAVPRQEGSAARSELSRAQPGVAVAQRASLIEETGAGETAPPATTRGRATWRLDTVNGEQGQPLQSAVVATIVYPDAGFSLVMTIQRNLDATLPASHTVSLAFSQTGAEASSRTVQDVGLLQGKDEEAGRGSPVSGLPVRVRENLFLIGLSSLRGDVERNTEILLRRNWFDIAVRYTSGRRAVLTFEKGANGAQVMQSAFDAWQ